MSVRYATVTAMQAAATSGFNVNVATTCYVDSLADFFNFKAGSTTTTLANVIVPSSDGLGKWHRMWVPANKASTAIRIEPQTLSAVTTYASVLWTADAYRELTIMLRASGGTFSGMGITLTGIAGTYTTIYDYQNIVGFAPGGFGSTSAWMPGGWSMPMGLRVWLDVRSGAPIWGKFSAHYGSGVGEQKAKGTMRNTTTTGGVTGVAMTFTGGTFTGDVEIWGVPT